MPDPSDADATALADSVRKKQVHPSELVEAAIAAGASLRQAFSAEVLDEGFLQRVQHLAVADAFAGRYVSTVSLHGQRDT